MTMKEAKALKAGDRIKVMGKEREIARTNESSVSWPEGCQMVNADHEDIAESPDVMLA